MKLFVTKNTINRFDEKNHLRLIDCCQDKGPKQKHVSHGQVEPGDLDLNSLD